MPTNDDNLAVRRGEPLHEDEYLRPNRKRAFSFVLEVFASVVVAAAVSVFIQWTVNRLPIERQSNEPHALMWPVVLVLSCAMLVLLWRPWSRVSTVAAWILPAALTTTVLALRLFGTPFYLFGTNGDQFFRMQYLQRLTVSPWLADDNYRDLPPFYPAGWFWLGGRFANLIDHPAWTTYKPFAILTIAVVSSLSFVLWSLVVASRRKAFGVAAVFALAGTTIGPYEPYAWFAMVFVPPLAVLTWRLFKAMADGYATTDFSLATVLIGIGLGITAATYTLVFVFATLVVVAMAILALVTRRLDGSPARSGITARSLAARLTTRLLLIGLAALPITLLTWGPYLYSAVHMPAARNAAAQYLSRGMARLDAPMLQPSLTGAICMIGLIWVILAWQRNAVAQAFGITVLGCVLWQLLSTVALAAETTLLSARVAKVGEMILWCACAFAIFDLIVGLSSRFELGNRRSIRTAVSVIAVLVMVELTQAPPGGVQNLLGGAFTSYDANGRAATRSPGPSPGRFNKHLIDTIARLSERRPQDNILLTNNYQLLVFEPYYGFQMNKEQYANPLARYPDRNRELARWAKSKSPAELISRLTSSEFAPPNVFVFRRDDAGNYPFRIVTTEFPKNNETHTITFPAELFESSNFNSREVGPFTVIVRT